MQGCMHATRLVIYQSAGLASTNESTGMTVLPAHDVLHKHCKGLTSMERLVSRRSRRGPLTAFRVPAAVHARSLHNKTFAGQVPQVNGRAKPRVDASSPVD